MYVELWHTSRLETRSYWIVFISFGATVLAEQSGASSTALQPGSVVAYLPMKPIWRLAKNGRYIGNSVKPGRRLVLFAQSVLHYL